MVAVSAAHSSSNRRHHARRSLIACLLAAANTALAQSALPSATQPGQPTRSGTPGTFEIVGMSVASGQQMFLGTEKSIYIVDKTENNPTQVNGHPAWAAEYHTDTDQTRPLDIVTNSFCAGGNVLGNGTWMNVGGNQAVTWGGLTAQSQTGGAPYDDLDGGQSVRLLNPCDDQSCQWDVDPALQMTTRRWYPSLETLADGSMFIMGGDQWGGYVNDANNNNPTYEYFPSRGAPIGSPLLENTLPANLFPILFLLPSGLMFVQLNWATAVLDLSQNQEFDLDEVPDAVRTYPASAGVAMLPLTPANNWTATIILCGGTNLQPDQWTESWNIAQYPSSNSVVKITPDVSGSYVEDDPLPEGRVMGSFVLLPNGKGLLLNGANTGTAGYGNDSWAVGQSYADHPVMNAVMYDPEAPAGQRWSRDGLQASTVMRMYHSTAVLLPDGSVFVSGSNPNADYNVGAGVTYPTEYRTERFYPLYYNERRPQPVGLPSQLGYGGAYFNVSLDSDDLFGNAANAQNTTVVVMRPGFSTHALAMGQRLVQLNNTYTTNADGSATLHVSQLPPNPNIIVPGPAYIYVVVNGVPSVGIQIMIGSGQIGTQPVNQPADLPATSLFVSSNNSGSGSGSNGGKKNAASSLYARSTSKSGVISLLIAPIFALALLMVR